MRKGKPSGTERRTGLGANGSPDSLARIRSEAPSCLPPSAANVWSNDAKLLETYRKRCRREIEEMTCAAQAAEILAPLVADGETLLDAGCAAGYYYWSFASRGVPLEYHGLDYTPEFIALARSVYRQNDARGALKREINLRLGSEIVEEKSYRPY